MADLVKQTCQARPGELVASAGRVPLLLPALTRPELARRVQQPQNLTFLEKYDVYAYIMIVLWSYDDYMVYMTLNWVVDDELSYDIIHVD